MQSDGHRTINGHKTGHEIGQASDTNRTTAGQLADKYGVRPDTMRRAVHRNFGRGIGLNKPLTEEQINLLLGETKAAPVKAANPVVIARKPAPRPVAEPQPEAPADRPARWRFWVLLVLMLVPTAASVQNMYTITLHIGHSQTKAVLLTAMLSASALGFAAVGVKNWYALALAIVLIAFESFCNLTAIYDGLMGGLKANPTRFLGVVTDIFSCGSYGAALTLGIITALLIAAVQFTALFHLKKEL